MNTRALFALAVGMLITTTEADAGFISTSVTLTNHNIGAGDPGAGAFAGQAVTTYQVWARFGNAGDALTAVYGNANSPMTIHTTSPGGFFNNALGNNLAPNPALFGVSPSLAWDSYATIGVEPGSVDSNTGLSPGFPATFPNGVSVNTNIGWFTGGPLPQGTAGADLRVLVMQLTVPAGGLVFGSFGIQYRPAGAPADVQVNNVIFSRPPSPGTLAALGVAAVFGRPRRRR